MLRMRSIIATTVAKNGTCGVLSSEPSKQFASSVVTGDDPAKVHTLAVGVFTNTINDVANR